MLKHDYWAKWACFLQRTKLKEPLITLLEAAGPLKILLAQAMYVGQPFVGGSSSKEAWGAFTQVLEDQKEAEQFIHFLHEEERS